MSLSLLLLGRSEQEGLALERKGVGKRERWWEEEKRAREGEGELVDFSLEVS